MNPRIGAILKTAEALLFLPQAAWRQRRKSAHVALFAILSFIGLLWGVTAASQTAADPPTDTATLGGPSVSLLRALKNKGTTGRTKAGGNVAYEDSKTTGKFDLEYTPPATSTASSDEVTYKADDDSTKIITVAFAPASSGGGKTAEKKGEEEALGPNGVKILATGLLATDKVTKAPEVGTADIKQNEQKTELVLVYTAPANISQASATVEFTDKRVPKKVSIPLTNQPRSDTSKPDDKSSQLIGTNLNGSNFGPLAFKALLTIFVMATLIESGLAVLFHWSPFLRYFNTKGIGPIISFIFAFVFVEGFHLDITAKLVEIMWEPAKTNFFSQSLSALILAGGSKTVNGILVALGWRSLIPDHADTPKPAKTDAWVSVCVVKKPGTKPGPVEVWLSPGTAQPPARLVSIVEGNRALTPFMRMFLRDPTRFPPSGGHTVTPGVPYVLRVVESGQPKAALEMAFTPEAGAILDFVADLAKAA